VKCEILYLAYNRLAYTQASFRLLRENTNWRRVSRLIVYDDGSTDGTAEWLEEAGMQVPVPVFEFRPIHFGAPAATRNDYASTSEADIVVKIDNDIAVPPLWLEAMLSVMKRSPQLELLGMDGGRHGVADPYVPPSRCHWEDASHIGGVGAIRLSALHRRPAVMARGRFGWTEWQHRHEPVRGWITPGLAVAQLDLIPEQTWETLAADYVAKGWARYWTPYSALHPWWAWIGKQLAKREAAA